MGRKSKVYCKQRECGGTCCREPCCPNKSASSFPGKVVDLQVPCFLSAFWPPWGCVLCQGLWLWHSLADSSASEGENVPLQLLPPVVPQLQVELRRQPPAGNQFNGYSCIYQIRITLMQLPVFTMFSHLSNCRAPDCTCTYFIPAIVLFC